MKVPDLILTPRTPNKFGVFAHVLPKLTPDLILPDDRPIAFQQFSMMP